MILVKSCWGLMMNYSLVSIKHEVPTLHPPTPLPTRLGAQEARSTISQLCYVPWSQGVFLAQVGPGHFVKTTALINVSGPLESRRAPIWSLVANVGNGLSMSLRNRTQPISPLVSRGQLVLSSQVTGQVKVRLLTD